MSIRLFIFFGAPGSGKSEVLQYLRDRHADIVTVLPKETTRKRRVTDSFEVVNVDRISSNCDLRYVQYGVEYGFSSSAVWNTLKEGRSAAVIVNDMRTIKDLRRKFGIFTRVIYVHSNIDHGRMVALAKERYTNDLSEGQEKETQKRLQKILTIHGRYIENTTIVDHTIINTGTFDNLYTQIESILTDTTLLMHRNSSSVKIFIIVGADHSGKDELVGAIQQMEPNRVCMYRKATNRPQRLNDKNELLHFTGEIPSEYDLTYEKQGFNYGIMSKDIWRELSEGRIVLLVLSEPRLIELLQKQFGSICTVLYLHANFDVPELRLRMQKSGLSSSEIEQRLAEIAKLHQLYVDKMRMFDHVLLNTSEQEDLYDQAYNLLEYYCY